MQINPTLTKADNEVRIENNCNKTKSVS
jgi:hypothetical protein